MSRLLRLVACHITLRSYHSLALVGPRPRVAEPIGPLNRLHFDDLGAEGTEITGEVCTRPECRQVKHFHAGERQGRIVARGSRTPERLWHNRSADSPRRGSRPYRRHRRLRQPERSARPPEGPVGTACVNEEPSFEVLRTVQDGCAVVDRRRGNAHRLAQFDDLAHGSLRKPRLGLLEELARARGRPA